MAEYQLSCCLKFSESFCESHWNACTTFARWKIL